MSKASDQSDKLLAADNVNVNWQVKYQLWSKVDAVIADVLPPDASTSAADWLEILKMMACLTCLS